MISHDLLIRLPRYRANRRVVPEAPDRVSLARRSRGRAPATPDNRRRGDNNRGKPVIIRISRALMAAFKKAKNKSTETLKRRDRA